MNEKVKTILIAIGGFFIGIAAFLVGRCFDRSGISSDNGNIGEIRTGIDEQRDINREVEQHSTVIRTVTKEIRANNGSAINGIRRAKQLLREAKNR